MKKILLTLLTVLCTVSLWADEVVLATSTMDGQTKNHVGPVGTSTADNNVMVGKSDGIGAGWILQCNNLGKGCNGSLSMTIDGKNYTSLKNSNGATHTVKVPEGYEATSVTFYAVSNYTYDNDKYKPAKLSNINGTSCSDEIADKGDTPTAITKSLNNVTSFTFTFSVTQVNYVVKVTYRQQATRHDVSANVATACTSMGSAAVTPAQVAEGSKATFTATPNAGYKFVNWTSDAEGLNEVSTANPYEPTITVATTLYANFAQATSYTASYAAGDAEMSMLPTDETVYEGSNYTLPAKNNRFYRAGYTVTGWDVNGEAKALGANVAVVADMTITPIFTENTVALGDATSTATWDFQTKNGCPIIEKEGAQNGEGFLVTQTTIKGNTIDVVLLIDAKSGKFQNKSNDDWAQVNPGTTFTMPSVPGTTIAVRSMGEPKDNSDEKSTFDGNEYTSYASNIATYSTESETGSSVLVIKGGSWYSAITATFPSRTAVYTPASNGVKYNLTQENFEANDFLEYTGSNWTTGKIDGEGSYTLYNTNNNTRIASIKVKGVAAFSINAYHGNNSALRGLNVKVGNGEYKTYAVPAGVNATTGIITTGTNDEVIISFYGNGSVYPEYITCYTTTDDLTMVNAPVNATVGYGTFYCDYEVAKPANTQAYTAILNDDKLTLNEINGDVIPAQTPVILTGDGGEFKYSNTGATFSGTNDLKGCYTATQTSSVTGGTVCVLGYEDSTAGFYRYDGATLGANKAYLVVPASNNPAKGIRISFGGNTPTGINAIENAKVAENGAIYNLAGQRVNANAKGIVIINGKKYVK